MPGLYDWESKTALAYNDDTLEELWRFNVGTALKGAPESRIDGVPWRAQTRLAQHYTGCEMANLASFDLQIALQDCAKMIACARVLLGRLDQALSLPYQKPLRHITDYMIGELEKCASSAVQLQTLRLASATRNLFELSFTVDYVCASDKSMDRFLVDAAIDELEIMQKFHAIDKEDANYQPDQKSQHKEQNLKAQIANANLTGSGPLQALAIAKAVNREGEYRALYKVYSKITHATAWAILGACSWENMALLLLLKTNSYAAECVKHIAEKSGMPPNNAARRV